MDNDRKAKTSSMDAEDWKRVEELVHQAGGVANAPSDVPDVVRADAMSFHTLGLCILELNNQMRSISDRMARIEAASNKPVFLDTWGNKLNV
jgi:hypothetical protein